tara:strand:- start:393 stop:854 length:462 start_codon:yes stop_codon:yes gene_type:complete
VENICRCGHRCPTVEQLRLYFGTWVYYGYQPFKIGFIPVWWIFANTAAVLVPFILIYKLAPKLTGLKQLLVIVLLPSGAFLGHAAVGWPIYSALGTNTDTFPHSIIQVATALCILLSIAVVWTLMQVTDIAVDNTVHRSKNDAVNCLLAENTY